MSTSQNNKIGFVLKSLINVLLLVYLIYFISVCNQTYLSSYGTIMSPNFPDQYPDSVTCTYLIKSPLNLPMALTFTAFEVETAGSSGCYDFVRVSTLRSYGVFLLKMSMLLFEILILIQTPTIFLSREWKLSVERWYVKKYRDAVSYLTKKFNPSNSPFLSMPLYNFEQKNLRLKICPNKNSATKRNDHLT